MEVTISGTVYEGKKLASERGMPTANIISGLPRGVYTGDTSYGSCLIFVSEPPETEVHIIGVHGIDLYGYELKVTKVMRIPEIITELAREVNRGGRNVNDIDDDSND